MYKLELYMLRHGKTIFNEERLYCGTSNPSLSEKGRSELIELLKDIKYPQCNEYFTSGATRANETFEILYPNEKYEVISGFSEYDFGDFEGKSYEMLKKEKAYIDWITDDLGNVYCPNGESKKIYRNRIVNTFKNFIRNCEVKKLQSVMLVSHGGTIGTILELFYDKRKSFYQWQPECGKGYKLTILVSDEIKVEKVEEVK